MGLVAEAEGPLQVREPVTVKTGALILALVAGAVILRELFPKRELVASPPRIQTVHDTVATVDTLWLRHAAQPSKPDTIYLERISVTPPETVLVAPRLVGMTGLIVAPWVGDSTVMQGFRLAPVDTGYTVTQWQAQFYTMGPVRAVTFLNGTPQIGFGPPPEKPCRFGCKLKHYATGALFGAAVWEVFR